MRGGVSYRWVTSAIVLIVAQGGCQDSKTLDADVVEFGPETSGGKADDALPGDPDRGGPAPATTGPAEPEPEASTGSTGDFEGSTGEPDVDEPCTTLLNWYVDDDGDGYGSRDDVQHDCVAPPGHVANPDDCDDGDPLIHPEAAEVCDAVDNDCDDFVDEPSTANPFCAGCTMVVTSAGDYAFCDDVTVDWTTAAAECDDRFDTDLAVLQSPAESLALAGALSFFDSQHGWSIGLTDQDAEGEFTWVDGTPLSAASWPGDWAPGQPNHDSNQDCVEIRRSLGYLWNDRGCGHPNHFICEFE